LGAQRGELQRMFMRHGLVLAGIGMVLGLGAWAGQGATGTNEVLQAVEVLRVVAINQARSPRRSG
jgi:ABC-type lipoprotein release transport system permease subunit